MTKTVTLGEICVKILSGGTPSTEKPEFWGGAIPWITSADIKDHYTAIPRKFLTEKAGADVLPAGNVLVVTRVGLGKLVVNQQPLAFSQDLQGLILKPNVDRDYLVYALSQKVLRFKEISRGATIKGVTRDDLVKIQLPLPPLPRQRQIATMLDRADSLRQKDRQLLSYYDQLAQSTFMDLFGDGKQISYQLGELTANEKGAFTNGPFGSDLLTSELTSEGVPVVYIRDIRNGHYRRVSKVFVTDNKAKALRNCQIIGGDILVAKVGDPPGISAVYPDDEEMAVITQDVIKIRLDKKKVLPRYVQFYLNSEAGKQAVEPIIVQGTRSRFSLGGFKKVSIPVPPLALQQKLAAIIERIEQQKAVVQQQIVASESLFQRLLQDSFGA